MQLNLIVVLYTIISSASLRLSMTSGLKISANASYNSLETLQCYKYKIGGINKWNTFYVIDFLEFGLST